MDSNIDDLYLLTPDIPKIETGKQVRRSVLWHIQLQIREPRGSVVECLTQDRGVSSLSLTGITALCPWARYINPCLLSTCSTQEDLSWHSWKIVDWYVKIKSNKTNYNSPKFGQFVVWYSCFPLACGLLCYMPVKLGRWPSQTCACSIMTGSWSDQARDHGHLNIKRATGKAWALPHFEREKA